MPVQGIYLSILFTLVQARMDDLSDEIQGAYVRPTPKAERFLCRELRGVQQRQQQLVPVAQEESLEMVQCVSIVVVFL